MQESLKYKPVIIQLVYDKLPVIISKLINYWQYKLNYMLILSAARKPAKRKANNEQEPADEVKVLMLISLSFTKGLKEVLSRGSR